MADGDTPLTSSPPTPGSRPWGKGFLAVCASILLTGLGHFLFGARRRGAVWFLLVYVVSAAVILSLVRPGLLPLLPLLVPAALITTMLAYIDAWRVARRSPKRLGGPLACYAAGVTLLAVAAVLSPSSHTARFLGRYVHTCRAASTAMQPTLQPGDCFIVHYGQPPVRWSLVVLHHPEYGENVPIVSRLVGQPGETVGIQKGELRINDRVFSRPAGVGPYVTQEYLGRKNPQLVGKLGAGCGDNAVHLGPDEYFVLGDNSKSALDARLWETPVNGHQLGALPADHLVPGRVTAIYWPPHRWRLFD